MKQTPLPFNKVHPSKSCGGENEPTRLNTSWPPTQNQTAPTKLDYDELTTAAIAPMTSRTRVKLGIPPDSPMETIAVPLFSSPSLGVPMSSRSSQALNNNSPSVEGPWYRCDDCGLEYATYAEATACEEKHLQENDRRYEIKMIFTTLLYNQEDLQPASNDIKGITDIMKGGGAATATTILQSKELLFDYLDSIRNEILLRLRSLIRPMITFPSHLPVTTSSDWLLPFLLLPPLPTPPRRMTTLSFFIPRERRMASSLHFDTFINSLISHNTTVSPK